MERERKGARFHERWSADARFDNWRRMGGYCLAAYLINLVISLLFLFEVKAWDAMTVALMVTLMPVYALAYTVPAALLTLLPAAFVRSGRAQKIVAAVAGTVFFSATQLLLLADYGLLKNFGYHFNPFVWNLLTTPGGFASMGVRSNTIILLSSAIAADVVLNGVLAYFILFFRGGAASLRMYRVFKSWRKVVLTLLLIVLGLTGAVIFAWSFHMSRPTPLLASKCIPAFQRVRMSRFFKLIGVKEPTRDELLMRVPGRIDNYPRNPIRRRADRRKYNVVWLACESWRADMLTPEVMPKTWSFAEKHCIRFTRNYSGGNNTRMGVFSMFYGLYGSYWHSFLDVRKGALLIDWMIEDGYDIQCFTSAKFSYPEFDKTMFARLPASSLHSDDEGVTYVRDTRNTARLLKFIGGDHGGRPFMAFMFFESPHYPYEFPPENAVFKPFVEKVDYLELGPSRAEEIKNRCRNCCRTLDGFLGQVFDMLEKQGRLDDTIIVVLGDHGEEFFEHGMNGHGQNFTDVQTRTPLIIHLPGQKPRVYGKMSSHLDVPAILAPYFGVENPASDFSHGMNLLAPEAPVRRYTVITQYENSFFTGEKYKMPLPLDKFGSITARAYDADDRELPNTKVVYDEYQSELMEVLRELSRFIK